MAKQRMKVVITLPDMGLSPRDVKALASNFKADLVRHLTRAGKADRLTLSVLPLMMRASAGVRFEAEMAQTPDLTGVVRELQAAVAKGEFAPLRKGPFLSPSKRKRKKA